MPDLIRHPEVVEFTGFRLSPEWRQKRIPDFLRELQNCYVWKLSPNNSIFNYGSGIRQIEIPGSIVIHDGSTLKRSVRENRQEHDIFLGLCCHGTPERWFVGIFSICRNRLTTGTVVIPGSSIILQKTRTTFFIMHRAAPAAAANDMTMDFTGTCLRF